jgi:hypothetical protein
MNIYNYNQFKKNQTLTNLEKLKNNGIKLFNISNGEWKELHEFTLPFDQMIPLYKKENGQFKFYAIGVY